MSFDDPRVFTGPSLIPMDGADRNALVKLLALVLEAEPPTIESAPLEAGRAQLAKWLYDQRRRREQFLPPELFAEPAWDILLILYWARNSQRRLSVSAVCASAGAPTSTALRYIDHLCRTGHVVKDPHPTDRRVSWLTLSDETDASMGDYFGRMLGKGAARPDTTSTH